VGVQITPEMNDPLDVSIGNTFMEMKPEDSISVSASVAVAAGPVNYAWHLNGETKMIGQTCMIDGLTCGVYNLSVTAMTVDGKRAGQADFVFRVTGQASGAGLQLLQGSRNIAHKSTFDFDTIPTAVAGTFYTRDTPPFYVAPGPDGHRGLNGERIMETIPMKHVVLYNLYIGRGGYFGNGNYVNANGYNGKAGGATTLEANGELLNDRPADRQVDLMQCMPLVSIKAAQCQYYGINYTHHPITAPKICSRVVWKCHL
jgi:hypothetical protein